MDIQNYITKRKQDEHFESETESDNLSASANSGWKKEYDTLRVFQENWTNGYFVIPSKSDNKPQCFLCKITVSISKDITIEIIRNQLRKNINFISFLINVNNVFHSIIKNI